MSSINQNLSLFIPHMFPNITEDRIASIFNTYSIGFVSRVDFVGKTDKNGKFYNAAYVHFDAWFNNSAVENFQERVLNPNKEARIVYDDPWYWIVLENTAAAPKDAPAESFTNVTESSRSPSLSLRIAPEVSAKYVASLERLIANLRSDMTDRDEKIAHLVFLLDKNDFEYIADLEKTLSELRFDNAALVEQLSSLFGKQSKSFTNVTDSSCSPSLPLRLAPMLIMEDTP